MVCQPLRAWSAEQRSDIESAATALWRTWCESWGLDLSGCYGGSVRCRAVVQEDGIDGTRWRAFRAEPSATLWWDARSMPHGDAADLLAQALFGNAGAAADTLVREIAQVAWDDLGELFLQWLGAAQRLRPAEYDLHHWSGAVVLDLTAPRTVLHLLVQGDAVAAWLEERSPARGASSVHGSAQLGSMLDRLDPVPCTVAVELQPLELTLGTLRGLRIGDVVQMDHRLDAPLLARADGQVICGTFLGQSGGRRAIELANASRSTVG
jgi:flagellar motor switch/type III secretory pathway protein FliN